MTEFDHAERAVLGSMMLDNSAIDNVVDILVAEDFSSLLHRETFSAIVAENSLSGACDPVTLADKTELDLVFLAGLVRNTPAVKNVMLYAKIVRDRAIERRLGQVGTQIIGLIDDLCSTEEKIDCAQSLVMAIADSGYRTKGPVRARNILPAVMDLLDERLQKGGEISGLATGWGDLDRITSGLHSSDLVIVAGRPGMGKTTLAMNIAEYVAIEKGNSVGVFSMEMSAEQLIERSMSALGCVDHQKIRSAQLADGDWASISRATAKIADAKLFIDDSPALSIHELRGRARRLKREHGLDLIVVDYLQLMTAEAENQTQRIGQISAGLKSIAKELKIPVVALSQLSRKVEERANKRPMMSDLRDSGNIEQDADVVVFVYRDEQYNSESPNKGVAELIISKQRNGPTGTVYLAYRGEQMRFSNFVGEYRPTEPERKTRSAPVGFEYSRGH